MTKKRIHLIIIIAILSVFLVGCKSVHFKTFTGDEDKAPVTEQTTKNEKETNTSKETGSEGDKEELANNASDHITNEDKTNEMNTNEGNTNEVTVTIQPVQTKELKIYSINDDSYELEDAIALVPMDSKITPEFIVQTVVDTLQDLSLEVGYHEVTTKDDTVIVDLRSDMAPVYNVGAGFEGAILDAIAQSLLDNLDNYKKVIFRVDGKAYATGHIELGFDEIYLEE